MSDLPTITVTTDEIRQNTTLILNPRGHYLYPEQYGFDRSSGKQEHLVRVTKYLELTPNMVLF
jgi:hypothetical protein